MKTTTAASKASKNAEGSVREATVRLGQALGRRALSELGAKVSSATENLMTFGHGNASHTDEDVSDDRRQQGDEAEAAHTTTIVETADVGVPVEVAYDQWTRFTEFPSFMRTVEHVAQAEDDKLTWNARMFWSRRTWKSTIIEQTPDEQIVWRSSGPKGYAHGAVTFHELAPALTRIVLVLEYHPKGLFEHLGNLTRAQSRRARQDLRRFQQHVMTHTALHSDELRGWRGEIHDGEVIPPEEAEDESEADEPEPDESEADEPEADESEADESPRKRRASARRNRS